MVVEAVWNNMSATASRTAISSRATQMLQTPRAAALESFLGLRVSGCLLKPQSHFGSAYTEPWPFVVWLQSALVDFSVDCTCP